LTIERIALIHAVNIEMKNGHPGRSQIVTEQQTDTAALSAAPKGGVDSTVYPVVMRQLYQDFEAPFSWTHQGMLYVVFG
jgi:hypothetical protein